MKKIMKTLATEIIEENKIEPVISLMENALPYALYGAEHIEEGARKQMDIAMRLPVTAAGALMPDAHQGYGLPIGGVLATRNAIIPYGVGVALVVEWRSLYLTSRRLTSMKMKRNLKGN
nr:RtcB family protein [Pedobacter panaciterrae]